MKKQLTEADYFKQFDKFSKCYGIMISASDQLCTYFNDNMKFIYVKDQNGNQCRVNCEKSYKQLMKSLYGKVLRHMHQYNDNYVVRVPCSYEALEFLLSIKGYF